jgi:EmrB/QacA subfamily drug resistance transporter
MSGQPRRGVVLAAALMGVFTAAVEATIVATALPTIVAELGGFHLLSWVFAAYFLAQTATIPIFGRLADVYGRKPIFFIGMGIFLVGSLMCGFAHSMGALIAYRLLQGLGAGAIGPVTSTIVGDIYGPLERPRIQVYLSTVWGVSSVAGPLLGAFIVQHAQWPFVFWINVPVGITAIALLAVFMKERPERRQHQIDYLGSVLLMIGTSALVVAITQSTTLSGLAVAGMVGLAAVTLAVFAVHEAKAKEPILPLALWRNRLIRTGNSASLMMGAVLMSVSAFMPTYLQGIMGYTSTVSGVVLGCLSLGWTAASFAGGRIMIRTSYRMTALLAGVSIVAGSILLILLTPEKGALWAGCGSVLVGFGLGFGNVTYLVALQSSVGWSERGIVTSSNLFARLMGQSLGAALFGAILNFGVYRQLPDGSAALERLMEPTLRDTLDAAQAQSLIAALAHSLHDVYLLSGLFAAVVFLLAFRVPSDLSPRSHDAAQQGAHATGRGEAANTGGAAPPLKADEQGR